MNSYALETLTRRAADAGSRRSSLLTLGGAALATTVASPGVSAAKKKSSDKCKKNEKKRCNNDAAACKATLALFCDPAEPAACLEAQACCDDCSATGVLTCQLAMLE